MKETVRAVADWMKGTDLVEVAYRRDGTGFSLTGPQAEASVQDYAAPAGRYAPVVSSGVGVLQWSAPGQPRRSEEGAEVSEGDVLAVVVAGSGPAKPVKASRAGRVAKVLAEAGQAVEYGQPLLLIEEK